jgi:uncharacterized protein (TIGR02284 family)
VQAPIPVEGLKTARIRCALRHCCAEYFALAGSSSQALGAPAVIFRLVFDGGDRALDSDGASATHREPRRRNPMTASPREVLNSLIETCKDGERGLLHAAELVTDPALKTFFTDTAHRRAELAAQLVPHAQRLGGTDTADGTAGATLHRKWMDVRSALSGHDDRAVVVEAQRGDSITVQAFKSAVEGALPATVRDLIEQAYDDVAASHLRFTDLNGATQ